MNADREAKKARRAALRENQALYVVEEPKSPLGNSISPFNNWQCSYGFTDSACAHLTGDEFKVLMVMGRLSYGWNTINLDVNGPVLENLQVLTSLPLHKILTALQALASLSMVDLSNPEKPVFTGESTNHAALKARNPEQATQ